MLVHFLTAILQPLRDNLAFLLFVMIDHYPRTTFLMPRWLLPPPMNIEYKILHLLKRFYRLRLIKLLLGHLCAYLEMTHLLQSPYNAITHLSLWWWWKWKAILKMRAYPQSWCFLSPITHENHIRTDAEIPIIFSEKESSVYKRNTLAVMIQPLSSFLQNTL